MYNLIKYSDDYQKEKQKKLKMKDEVLLGWKLFPKVKATLLGNI